MSPIRHLPRAAIAVASVSAMFALAACGGGGSDSSDSSSQQAASDFDQKGPITFATGKDTSGYLQTEVDSWNKDHPDEKVTVRELPDEADQQRAQMIQNAQNKSDAFTVLSMDVVWTAEFAANQYVDALPEDKFDLASMLPATVDSGKYFNKLYGVPYTSDGALLYYRSDLLTKAGISEPPKTWDEMKADCEKVKATKGNSGLTCYGGQFNKYEGLTVNVSEAIDSAGGSVLSDDGKTPTLNTPEAKAGMDFLVDGFKSGMMDKGELTWTEEESRNAFQSGKVLFLRNWPYIYALANKDDGSSKVNGKFGVAPLPGKDGPGVSSLGGHNIAINKYAKNKGTAVDFIKFMTSEQEENQRLQNTSQAPVITSLYDNKDLQKKFPYLPDLKTSIENAEPRPKAVKYGDVTLAIQDGTYSALQGNISSDKALQQIQQKLQPLLK